LPSAGAAVASLGDHDGDGICDLILGSPGADLAGIDAGAAWIVFLNRDGTSKAQVLITEGWGGFTGDLARIIHDEADAGAPIAPIGEFGQNLSMKHEGDTRDGQG
jgi:hypothetical protein